MRRRTLLLGAVSLVTLGGCARNTPSPGPTTSIATSTSGIIAVTTWSVSGGQGPNGVRTLRPPKLVVYASGEVIADAAYQVELRASELTQLLSALTTALRAPDVARRKPSLSPSAGTGTTTVLVRSAEETLRVEAEGLDELREQHGYSDAMYTARDRLGQLHDRVVATGQPYTAGRVRTVTEPVTAGAAQRMSNWPGDLPDPAIDPGGNPVTTDLDGTQAAAAVRSLSRDLDLKGSWPIYRTSAGHQLRAAWRYLLPDE